MSATELIEMYKSLLDTWRFEVNSHWQRSSYFAAFETVAVAGCWKLLAGSPRQPQAAVGLSVLGILLTCVWLLNNDKTRYYARYWFTAVEKVERRLAERTGEQNVDFAAQILHRRRTDWIRHPYLVQAVPLIFLAAWGCLLSLGLRPPVLESRGVRGSIGYEPISLALALASLALSAAAALIAKSTLSQAKQVAERDRMEWRQRKWADMYLRADEVYDLLDRFHTLSNDWTEDKWLQEWNELMRVIRGAHAMALAFPINPATDAFVSSTAVFKDERAVSKERLSEVFEAVHLIREKARLPVDILG